MYFWTQPTAAKCNIIKLLAKVSLYQNKLYNIAFLLNLKKVYLTFSTLWRPDSKPLYKNLRYLVHLVDRVKVILK
jgi:hypothetical protein